MAFKRSIGLVGFTFCIIGAIVGSGWLLGPFFAAKMAGPAAVVSWIVGGIMMATILITYAELSTLLPFSGGPIRYMQFSHGTIASFTIAWITWLATVATAPVETLAIIRYATNYLPELMHKTNNVYLLDPLGYAVAAFLLFLMTIINFMGARLLSKSNNYIVFFKLLVPVLTVIVLVSINFHTSNFYIQGFAPEGWKGILMALPSAGVIFSLMGCHAALQLSGEVKNPQRNIPIAIILGLSICTLLYTVIQIAFIGTLEPADFNKGWSLLSFPGDMGPFVGLATALGALWLTKILFLDAFLSPYGCGLVYTGAAARLGCAMAKNGYFPPAFTQLNRYGVPAKMLGLNYFVGLLLFLPFPAWQSMMSFLVSALILGYAAGPIALGILRKSLKHHHRPFKVPAAHVFGFLGFFSSNLLMLWVGWDVVSKMLIAILLGYIVLAFYKLKAPKHELPLHMLNGLWLLPYLLCLALISYLSSFAGVNLLPFGWDFLAIGLLSLVVYVYTQKAGLDGKEYLGIIEAELKEVL